MAQFSELRQYGTGIVAQFMGGSLGPDLRELGTDLGSVPAQHELGTDLRSVPSGMRRGYWGQTKGQSPKEELGADLWSVP